MVSVDWIETERLVLREVTRDDAADMLRYLSDPGVVLPMGLEPFGSVEAVWDEIDWYRSILADGTGIRWGITLKDSGKVIGSCGFLNRATQHSRAEIGYELSRDFWGRGIAAEALHAVLKFGFTQLSLNRIEALTEPANLPSQKLLEARGFMREGLLRDYECTRGEFEDLYMYSVLKRDFRVE